MKEMVGGCCVCADDSGWPENPLVYCDGQGCDVAVHQGCYGILQVPDGNWFCARCAANDRKALEASCELCVSTSGALKRTLTSGWAHVICALYIPEVKFGDVNSMEPVILNEIPEHRFNATCYICEGRNRLAEAKKGACMECSYRFGCKKFFHVTCAQQRGLLCEEGGESKNVKYCGYCSHHLKKVKDDPGIKTIPAFRPVKNASRSDSGSSTPDSRWKRNGPHPVANCLVDGGGSPLPNHIAERSNGPSSVPPPPPRPSSAQTPTHAVSAPPTDALAAAVVISCAVGTAGIAAVTTTWSCVAGDGSATTVSAITAPLPPVPTAGPIGRVPESPNRNRVPSTSSGKESTPSTPGLPGKRGRGASTGGDDRTKRPRRSSKKTVKSLLESVSQVVDETVSSFQAERVAHQQQQREAAQHQLPPAPCPVGGVGLLSVPAQIPSLPLPSSIDQQPLPGIATLADTNYLQQIGHNLNPSPLKPIPRLGGGTESSQQSLPSSLEQLLERQWEQGSQVLMEQAQHFDIASLLSCLHQLKVENQRLEKDIMALAGRRDHLLAVNARLSIAFGHSQPSPHSPRVNHSSAVPADNNSDSSPSTALSHLRSLATSVSQGSQMKSAQTQAATPVLSPTGTSGSPGMVPAGYANVGSSAGVFTSVSRQSTKGSAEPSPERPAFLTPTPLLPSASLAQYSSLGANSQEHLQQLALLQHQAAAVYGGALAGLIQAPSTSPHRPPVHLLQSAPPSTTHNNP